MDEEAPEEFDVHLPVLHVPYDFRPIKIRVYRNGDENDLGKEIIVTRREFKHWIVFLDALTKRLDTTTAVNRLYTVHGERIDHFEDLQWKGEYVAVERAAFIPCEYGRYRPDRREDKKWKATLHLDENPPVFLNSAETMDIYLKHEGYGSCTGLPYPLDSILSHSPSNSALHIHSHAHAEKLGRSLEKLNTVGRPVWNNEDGKEQTKNEIHLPKLVGLDEPLEAKEKVSSGCFLPPLDDQQKSKETGELMGETVKKEERLLEVAVEAPCPAEGVLSKELERRNEPAKVEKGTEDKQEENGGPGEPREHIVIPILMPPSRSTSNLMNEKTTPAPPRGDGSQHSVHWSNDRSFDVDLDDNQRFERRKEPPPRKQRGVEKIFERSERRIVRQFSDDENHPVRDVVNSSASYKTYLWEARAFDPDFD